MNRRQKLIQQQFLNNEKRIIRRLDQVYAQALKDVNGNIERLMKRFDPDTGDLPQSAIYQLKYQNMVKDQLEGILNELQTKQFTSVAEYLDTCYEDGFVGSLFDLHGQDVPLMMPLDQEAMATAVQLDSKISKGLYTRLGEDVSTLKKRITAEVSRSIATGAAFADTAKQLAGKTRIGYNNAIRIARTEGHRIQNQATMNVMEQAKDRGADVVKQWDATLDGKTRESHVAVDGEIRELDEKFSNGLQFPGDPSGKAEEVINCRCAALQRARWTVGDGFAKWNNFTRQLETFDSPQDYGEFKKAFFSSENKRYMNYVQQMEDKYKSRDFQKILDRMTPREYKHYSRLLVTNTAFNKKAAEEVVEDVVEKVAFIPAKSIKDAEAYASMFADVVSYKGLSLDKANVINARLTELFEKYPVHHLDAIEPGAKGAMAANSHHLTFNPKKMGKALEDGHQYFLDNQVKSRETIELVRQRFAGRKIPPAQQHIIDKMEYLLEFKRYGVCDMYDDKVAVTVTHEFGHILADQFFGQINKERANPNYDTNWGLRKMADKVNSAFVKAKTSGDIHLISEYGSTNAHEFFAECFTMREYGESLPDYIADLLEEVVNNGIM